MKIRASLVVLVALACTLPAMAFAAPSQQVQQRPWNIASETYYTLDVPGGTANARVEALIQNASQKDLKEIVLWGMPRAQSIVVKQGEETLTTKAAAVSDEKGLPTGVTVTLAKPLAPKAKTNLVMTYTVPQQRSELVKFEAGSTEALFVSQGPGSFVYIDAPVAGENFFEPGCLKAKDQPAQVREAERERWICGDATLIALAREDKGTQERCAAADDKCRQRLLGSPFSAFAQSITDQSKRGTLEAEIPLKRGPVKLTLRYFRADEAWAKAIFPIAQEALPKMEALWGWEYPRDTILMRESNFIGAIGAAGVAFPEAGEVLVTKSDDDIAFDKEVAVHELAHQWAGGNLERNWLWEGLAEYTTKALAPEMGIKLSDRGWERLGYKDPLETWYNGSLVTNPDYWYGKAGAFWLAYEKALGGRAVMTSVLAQMDDDPKKLPLDGRWFMDKGERASGANLDELFLGWVWNRETATPLLKERRAAHDLVNTLVARAAELGLSGVPADIQQNLDDWQFSSIAGQVEKANAVLTDYAAAQAAAAGAGLPATAAVANSWGTAPTATTAGIVSSMKQAVDAITSAGKALAAEPADSPSVKKLAEAREKYAEGDLAAAKRLAAGSTTAAFNEDASIKLIELAKQTQAEYKPSFFSRIGLFFKDPAGDLAAAEKAYGEGDYDKALKLAKSAHDQWTGADRAGMMRLAFLAGAMCALSAAVWWLLKRLDPDARALNVRGKSGSSGHQLTLDEHKGSWRDWMNNP